MRNKSALGNEIWCWRVDFTKLVQCGASAGQKASKSPAPSRLIKTLTYTLPHPVGELRVDLSSNSDQISKKRSLMPYLISGWNDLLSILLLYSSTVLRATFYRPIHRAIFIARWAYSRIFLNYLYFLESRILGNYFSFL